VYNLLRLGRSENIDGYTYFVNWNIYANIRNKQGRWPLFTASEKKLKWSDGLREILEANGAAIENVDTATSLEAFMLAAVGSNSDLETVYSLLEDHPAAIIPYVKHSTQKSGSRKRKLSEIM